MFAIHDLFYQFFLGLSADDISRFESFNSVKEQIIYLYQFEMARNYPIFATSCGKSIDDVAMLKQQGNKAFKSKNYKLAASFYSRCLVKYPQNEDKTELSIIYANRSASLYYLEKYQSALNDIESAFEINYPAELAYKLYDRKGKCLLALKKRNAAVKCLKNALHHLEQSKLNDSEKERRQSEIQSLITSSFKRNSDIIKENPQPCNSDIRDHENQLKTLSASIKINFSPKMGRYAEAVNDISPGEYILSEDPFCALLSQEYQYTHCFNCFRRADVSYEPCYWCDRVIFCGKECRQIALATHHAVECKILGLIWASEVTTGCQMALRIITQNKLDYFLKHKQFHYNNQNKNLTNYTKPKSTKVNCDDSAKDLKYFSAYSLLTHKNLRSTKDIIERMHLAIFFVQCLQFSNYFSTAEKYEGKRLTENEIYITELLLHFLLVLQANSHEVSEFEIKNADIENSDPICLGSGVYPTLALFNHSCNPDVMRYFNGNTIVVRALRNIKRGEMVCDNYGPLSTLDSKAERQRALNAFRFVCECTPCVENWPLLETLNARKWLPFKCANNKCGKAITVPLDLKTPTLKCNNCNLQTNILQGLITLRDNFEPKLKEAKIQLKHGNMQLVELYTLETIKVLDNILVPPYKDYHICQQLLRQCYLCLGNKYNY